MLRKILTASLLAGFVAAPLAADTAANKQLVIDAMTNALMRGNVEAVDTYFADPYIQHNAMIPSGVAPLKGLVSKIPSNDVAVFEPVRIIAEGDLVATHVVYENFGPVPLVAFDVFRIEDGKIVEHWDNLAPLAQEPNPSGRTQIDGATEITDLDQTEANKALVVELIERMFIGGEQLDITQYISPVTYIQHNSMAADGLKGLGEMIAMMKEQGIVMKYDSIGLVVAEGNFVLTGAEGSLGGKPTAFYDLFRLEDGLIVEHWDVIADIQTENLPEGYPGKF